MKQFKVIKDFDEFVKGDILTEQENGDYVSYKENKEEDFVETITITVNYDFLEEYLNKDYLLEIKEETESNTDTCDCCDSRNCDKLNKVEELIDDMLNTYKKDYDELMEAFEQGDVQTCVKVEAETVYYNLTKVLNRIKEVINE